MQMQKLLLLFVALGAVTGCTRVTVFGQTVKDDHAPVRGTAAASQAPAPASSVPAAATAPAATALQPGPAITRLLIDFTPAATKQAADDTRFNADALRRAIADGLGARGLADLANNAVGRVAAIELDEFDVRATTNVVLMGHVASVGVLGAKVRIRDGSGTQLREFHIRAQTALNVDRNSRNPLENLYKEFAAQIIDDLTGTVRPPQPNLLRQ